MSEHREVRRETDFWGNDKEVIYEDNRRVGELRVEERGGFCGIGGERVKVEYDNNGREAFHSRQEERGGILGIGAENVEVRYDSSGNKISHSRVEERGGFLGFGAHHVRVEYDNCLTEISQTNTESRGGLLGFGGERVRVTRYANDNFNESSFTSDATMGGGGVAASSQGRSRSSGVFVYGLFCFLGCFWLSISSSSTERIRM